MASTESSSSTKSDSNKDNTSPTPLPGPPPPRYHNKTWKLLSQGAEARVWLIPSFFTITPSSSHTTTTAVCKERFPKSYRHPSLDASITKSRTKSEARCLVRCRRAGVPCPAVLTIDTAPPSSGNNVDKKEGGDDTVKRESSCLFLEYIDGCTVREYIESRSSSTPSTSTGDKTNDGKEDKEQEEPPKKKARHVDDDDEDINKEEAKLKRSTLIDENSLHVAYEIGSLVACMHNANVVHGDLTTSNIMLRNPPSSSSKDEKSWKAKLVLIDFGLAGTAGAKGVSHEEKAVDLYVLERAFVSTHPGSNDLVAEILRAYKGKCKTSDSVLQRLSQVRLRGRKRECFG